MSWESGESNEWRKIVRHRDCIYPCSGHPVLHHSPRKVQCAADQMPVYLACSECGCTPLPEIQPELVKRFLKYWLRTHDLEGRLKRKQLKIK